MCVASGQELCTVCRGGHNYECERYIPPTEECFFIRGVFTCPSRW